MKSIVTIAITISLYVVSCFASTEISSGIYDDVLTGQEILVDINVKTTVNLSDLTIVVAFNDNANVLEFDPDSEINVEARASLDFVDATSVPNSIKFVFGGLGSDFAVTPGDGRLFSFKLTAIQVGVSSITFPVITPCLLGSACPTVTDPILSVTDGSVTVIPSISINNASSVFEGGEGSSPTVSFIVSLNHAVDEVVSVDYATQNETASDENDYVFHGGTQ